MELFLVAKALETQEKKVIAVPETVRTWKQLGDYALIGNDRRGRWTVVRVINTEEDCFTKAGVTTCTAKLDTYTMKLLGIEEGGLISIRPAQVKEAKFVRLAPEEEVSAADIPIIKKALSGKVIRPGDLIPIVLSRGKTTLKVMEVTPGDCDGVVVGSDVEIEVMKPVKEKGGLLIDATFDDIGNYKEVKEKVREFIITPLLHPETYKRTGFNPPKGVLISGPPGSGKTLLVKAVVFETDANLVYAHASDILSDSYSESKAALEELFEEVQRELPAILCIEDIDLIAPRRGEPTIDVESKLTAALMNLMDNLKTPGVIVIGTTSNIDRIEPALRRAGRFDREIELPVPDVNARKEILKVLTRDLPIRVEFGLTEVKSLLDKLMKKYPEKALDAKERLSIAMRGDDIERVLKIVDEGLYEEVKARLLDEMFLKIAKKTHGFVGADLEALVREAIVNAIHRLVGEGYVTEDGMLSEEGAEKLEITERDFEEALRYVEPSALKEILIEVPEVHWDDIGGYEEVKKLLKEVIEWPLIKPMLFEATGIKPPKGVLLYGPPGTGKTLLAKAVATESGANFIAVKGPEVLSKWVGEGERKIREIFRKARQVAPTIIFFDEIDSIGQRRGSEKMHHVDSIINQLLTEMDGLESREKVIVIAATNRPDILDPALLRPGRFDRLILIPAPDEKARLEILKVHTKDVPLSSDVDLKALARKTEGYSGADLEALVREATIAAIRRVIKDIPEDATKEEIRAHVKVTAKDFEEAMKRVKASITKELMHYYERMEKNLKASIASKFADEYGKFW